MFIGCIVFVGSAGVEVPSMFDKLLCPQTRRLMYHRDGTKVGVYAPALRAAGIK
jgi:hypothetical protein